MSWKRRMLVGITVVSGLLLIAAAPISANNILVDSKGVEKNLSQGPFESLSSASPLINKPDWYFDTTIYYTVSQNGTTSDLSTFATLAHETLNDARGWSRLGVKFEKVASGGSLRLVLAQSSLLTSYSSGCSADWSCTVGNTVIINDDRWTGASATWNAAGGTLRDYRHMVINHETGHWLGHGHDVCRGAGSAAPVMLQQSIDLQGCKFNPWPLDYELTTTRF